MNTSVDFSKIRVLVIDDEAFMRVIIRRYLQTIGVTEITEAVSGADGLTKLMDETFDMVILDIMMGTMNGLKYLKAIRVGLTGAPRDLPVIALTGSEEHEILVAAMELDCNGFIRKSENMHDIKERMERTFGEATEIKSSGVYQAVKLPDIDLNAATPNRRKNPVSPPPAKAYEVPIEETEAGMVVARDVVTKNGDTLMPAGATLNAAQLNRLRDICELIDLPSIWVEM